MKVAYKGSLLASLDKIKGEKYFDVPMTEYFSTLNFAGNFASSAKKVNAELAFTPEKAITTDSVRSMYFNFPNNSGPSIPFSLTFTDVETIPAVLKSHDNKLLSFYKAQVSTKADVVIASGDFDFYICPMMLNAPSFKDFSAELKDKTPIVSGNFDVDSMKRSLSFLSILLETTDMMKLSFVEKSQAGRPAVRLSVRTAKDIPAVS